MKTNEAVLVWEEDVTIPTYGTGKPEKNPIFLEKRVYQGSSGEVYPHPVIEKIHNEKSDQSYHALFLENEYLKIMILPELGGRVQMAYDKIKQRHFIYHNSVIKPALVGLTGPWISGGIEFNWPQHHRPSTFEPIDFTIEEHSDGSKTVWVNEIERMFRTKGMAGFRLYPGKAYLEINVKLYNRTPFAQTFLWWANPAVKVNDHYQSVFPPDVHAVFDHGKRDVSEFPIARGTYYKVDYSAGVDISRYKNIPVPTSYMAIKSKYDFMGGYEHDTHGGLLHIANHHISPGKKQWTWGNGEFGYAWDRNLTDEDGPYVELMTGVFTDNQPDFSWIQPNEERTFRQYFMPYSELGVVKNASKDALVNLEIQGNDVIVKFYTTGKEQDAKAILYHNGEAIWKETVSISPQQPYLKTIHSKEKILVENLRIQLVSSGGKVLVEYEAEREIPKAIPDPAKPAKDPKEIDSIEQLFLTGLHIEQYRHATYHPLDYYQEALRREPGDARNNNAVGLWFLKRGQFAKAEPFFRKAINTLTERNPNPYDGEPYFNLGTCLFMQGRMEEAYEAWYKSVWSAAWQDAAYLNLARIEVRRSNYEEALSLVEKSLARNHVSHSARHLKSIILRKMDRHREALAWIGESLQLDKFNFGCRFEELLSTEALHENARSISARYDMKKIMRGHVDNYMEYAFDYAAAGLYAEAIQLLSTSEISGLYPMACYSIGYFHLLNGNTELAKSFYTKASGLKPDYCFPNRIEDVNVLQSAMKINPLDAKAPYYLGNFWYAKKQYENAIACWENSASLENTFPTVHRNLALAYHNKQGNPGKALQSLETAFRLDPADARVLMELDQLYKRLNKPHAHRLKLLEEHLTLTEDRDDLYLERIALHNLMANYERAKALIAAREFHPWEGGEGKVVGQYLISHLELAKKHIYEGSYEQALSLLEAAESYPHHLGEGKLYGAPENDIFFLKGCAYEGLGKREIAIPFFEKASEGSREPLPAIYYNDQQPDKILYQGLALKKLNNSVKAETIFNRLIDFGKQHLNDHIKIDYFAVSLPDLLVFDQDLDLRNKIHCHYMIGLGLLGLGDTEKAEENFGRVLVLDGNHQGAVIHLAMIQSGFLVRVNQIVSLTQSIL
jgi:tetratricopeptide (TPR) repeat protein